MSHRSMHIAGNVPVANRDGADARASWTRPPNGLPL